MDISLRSRSFKEKRQRHLLRAIAGLRVTERADITFVCGDQQFPAHKLILEASSPYFVNMFAKGGSELAKNPKIVYNTMAPETLEAILDFIYLGSVDTITTESQVKKVSVAANLMQLTQLVYYCCDALCSRVRRDTYIELWEIATKCNHGELKDKVLVYASENFDEVYATGEFLSLSSMNVKEFFKYATGKVVVLDRMLDCALKWLMNDVDEREIWAEEILACFNAKHVSKKYIASVLKDDVIMNSSVPIANSINKLAVAVFLFDCIQNEDRVTTHPSKCVIKEPLSQVILQVADGIEIGVDYTKKKYRDHWEAIRKALFILILFFVFTSIVSLGFTGILLWVMGFVGGGMVFRREIIESRSRVNSPDIDLKEKMIKSLKINTN